ncbi:ROK family protein [Mangrovibrevibacter kandeliae]|uniref:ROK family protein n=1 Tax=Mangrovibrevibacter kandeliae TaxID=2968473 RepID=UPI002118144D|nr:ROK family protein [Aurantimonas sp. CSK15Z-1]MCQ8781181.1 ROK family protein [Aurantimonas sp. CSK15Z-1]
MLSKADAEAVRAQNRRLVIDHFRHQPVSTRRRMSAVTGLSLSAASSIASDLVRVGILSESEPVDRQRSRGRPEVGLHLRGAAASVAVLKISVGEIAVSLADYQGQVLAALRRDVDLSALSADAFVALARSVLSDGLETLSPQHGPLRQVVATVQGVTDGAERRIIWSPILKPRGIDLATPLEALTGARVRVLNDCGVMPERFRWGNEIGSPDFAVLFIGFGVGMGLRLSGRTFRGAQSSAVEFGHLNHIPGGDLCRCGNRGCIEAYAGDYAIWRAAKGASPSLFEKRVPDAAMKDLADAAREGETAAVLAFERAGEAIGYGLGRLFTLMDPLPVVFIGSGAEAMDLLEVSIRRAIKASAIDGIGADTPFVVMSDVDKVTLEASTTLALAALDEAFSTAASGPVEEAAE